MASFTLILVAAIIATSRFSEASTDCSLISPEACQSKSVAEEFPQTREEFDTTCERVLEYMACRVEHEENCRKRESILTDMRSFVNIVEQVCNKETYLYSAVADNLVCIKKGIHDDSCDLQNEEELAKFEDQLKENGITIGDENGIYTGHCTSQLFYFGCRVAKIGNECGESARNAVTEILQSLIFPPEMCPEEFVNELPKVVIMLQEEILKEEVE